MAPRPEPMIRVVDGDGWVLQSDHGGVMAGSILGGMLGAFAPDHGEEDVMIKRGMLWLAVGVGLASSTVLASSAAPARADGGLFDAEVVRDLYLEFADPGWEAAIAGLGATGYVHADLVVDGTRYPDVGVRYKGNSSSGVAGRKKPFNIGLDAFVEGQDLLGYDTLNLNNGFVDPTMVREILTYATLRPFLPTPRAAFVRLHVNGAYFGLYLMVQQIERTYLDEWFASNDGYLFKADPPAGFRPGPRLLAGGLRAPDQQPGQPSQPGRGGRPDLRWLGEDLAAYKAAYELKTVTAGNTAYEVLREMIRALDAPVSQGGVAEADFPDAIAQVLDVDGALWYIAAHNLLANFDSYYSGHNYYLYWAEEDQRFHLLSWDMNESFGVFSAPGADPGDTQSMIQADPFLMSDTTSRPLIRRLLGVPAFRAAYLAHYRTLSDGALDPAILEARVLAYQALIRESVRTDPNRLYAYEDFDRNVWEDVALAGAPGPGGQTGRGRPVPGLLKLAAGRHAWLRQHPDLQSPDHQLIGQELAPPRPTAGDSPRVAVRLGGADLPSAVELRYRLDGSRPVAMGMAAAGEAWSGTIPTQPAGTRVSYEVWVHFADGRVAVHPAANAVAPWDYEVAGDVLPVLPGGSVVINELLAANDSGLADPAGELDDWVELVNRGPDPQHLAGIFLSTRAEDPWAFALPEVTLAPGEHLLIWCDNDPEQGADHAGFRLSKAGESLFLASRALNATVDQVTFGPQAADVSTGRITDGAPEWAACAVPSPRAANRCGPDAGGPAVRLYLPLAWRE
jgi:hypothetical protein